MNDDDRWPHRAGATLVLGLVGGMCSPLAADQPARRVHAQPELIRPALSQAATALMADDVKAAIVAVEQLEATNPRLFVEDNERFGQSASNLSQSLHKVLEGTKAYLHRGDVEEAFNEFVWVQRTCRACHRQARGLGLLPAEGTLWQPESERAESTQKHESTP